MGKEKRFYAVGDIKRCYFAGNGERGYACGIL